MNIFKNLWKHSRIRFYILNATSNYKFWLFSKKIYDTKKFVVMDNDYYSDAYLKIIQKKKNIESKRFIGYMYNNKIYLDNPGLENIDRDTWKAWKKKGLLE